MKGPKTHQNGINVKIAELQDMQNEILPEVPCLTNAEPYENQLSLKQLSLGAGIFQKIA